MATFTQYFERFVQSLSLVAWPLVVFVLVVMFRKHIVSLFGRVRTAKLPGGSELALIPLEAFEPSDAGQAPPESPDWTRSGDVFWLCTNLYWTVIQLYGGTCEGARLWLGRACHNLRDIGMESSASGRQLMQLWSEVEVLSNDDWTDYRRARLMKATIAIATELADIAIEDQRKRTESST